MMSRTCISETCSAPSIIDRASASRRFLSNAECSSLSSCSRSSGSRISSAESRSSKEGLSDSSMLAAGSCPDAHPDASPRIVVGIRITEFGEKLLFQGFHVCGFAPTGVPMPLEMQQSVHYQMREMGIQGLSLGERFTCDDGVAKDDVALHHATPRRVGETQHVGCVIAAAIATVENTSFGRADDPHGDLGRNLERLPSPAADLGQRRDGSGARDDLKMEHEARRSPATRSCLRHGGYSSP